MAFPTDLNFVIGAILELLPQMDQNPPALALNQLGPVIVTYCGNGRWQRSSSFYFNCGVNKDANTPGPVGEKGQLTPLDGHNAAFWFEDRYKGYGARVLQDGFKWNFTLVKNYRAFNFHIEVR
jgi:hypothetical protein